MFLRQSLKPRLAENIRYQGEALFRLAHSQSPLLSRFGTPTGKANSGILEEFELAYRAWTQKEC